MTAVQKLRRNSFSLQNVFLRYAKHDIERDNRMKLNKTKTFPFN